MSSTSDSGSGKGMKDTPRDDTYSPLEDTHSPKDMALVLGRQRKVIRVRPKEWQQCALLGAQCKYMPESGFDNCAKLKEDSQRHINGFQCQTCGKRFGKKYGLKRHIQIPPQTCKAQSFTLVHPKLTELLSKLEKAQGRDQIMEVMEECKPFLDWTRSNTFKDKRAPRVQAPHDLNALGPSDPLLAAPRSLHTSYVNDGVTGSLSESQSLGTMEGGEFGLEQQRDIPDYRIYASPVSQVYLDMITSLAMYPGFDPAELPPNDPQFGNNYGIYNERTIQEGVQEKLSTPLAGPSDMNAPFSFGSGLDHSHAAGLMTNPEATLIPVTNEPLTRDCPTTTAVNYPQNYPLSQSQGVAYGTQAHSTYFAQDPTTTHDYNLIAAGMRSGGHAYQEEVGSEEEEQGGSEEEEEGSEEKWDNSALPVNEYIYASLQPMANQTAYGGAGGYGGLGFQGY